MIENKKECPEEYVFREPSKEELDEIDELDDFDMTSSVKYVVELLGYNHEVDSTGFSLKVFEGEKEDEAFDFARKVADEKVNFKEQCFNNDFENELITLEINRYIRLEDGTYEYDDTLFFDDVYEI